LKTEKVPQSAKRIGEKTHILLLFNKSKMRFSYTPILSSAGSALGPVVDGVHGPGQIRARRGQRLRLLVFRRLRMAQGRATGIGDEGDRDRQQGNPSHVRDPFLKTGGFSLPRRSGACAGHVAVVLLDDPPRVRRRRSFAREYPLILTEGSDGTPGDLSRVGSR
jgi:hypothetical protein